METRRTFLAAFIVTCAASGFAASLTAQQQQGPVIPQERKPGEEPGAENPNLPSSEKRLLEENKKEIKKKVERLYELATELKAEADKTDSSRVLSLNLMKKAEEVEKLAREIKNRSKG